MSRTRTITLTLGTLAAGAILATGVTGLALADDTATPSPGTSSTAPGGDAAAGPLGMRGGPGDGMRGGPGGMHGMRGGPLGEPLHGELVVKAPDGTISTVRQVHGTVTAVSGSSITVKAEDGYTATFAVDATTEVRTGLPSRDRAPDGAAAADQSIADVSVGDVARVHGTVDGGTATAEHVHAMTAEQAATMAAERQQRLQDHAAASGTSATQSS